MCTENRHCIFFVIFLLQLGPQFCEGWNLKKFFYWSIVDLQCCVSFCCIAKWISHIHIYIYIYLHSFFRFFSHRGHYIILSFLCYIVGPYYESRSVMPDSLWPHGLEPTRLLSSWTSPGKKWLAIPFSRRSSRPRDETQVSCVAGRFFTIWATREA